MIPCNCQRLRRLSSRREHANVKAGICGDWEGAIAMSEPRRRTYTIEEAGQKLGVGRNSAYAAAQRGEIVTIKSGRRGVVPAEFLDRLVAGQNLQTGSPAGSGPQGSASREIAPRGSALR